MYINKTHLYSANSETQVEKQDFTVSFDLRHYYSALCWFTADTKWSSFICHRFYLAKVLSKMILKQPETRGT